MKFKFQDLSNIREPKNDPIQQKYLKLELLGEGSFGKVYKGISRLTGDICAIKQLDVKKLKESGKGKDIDVNQLGHEKNMIETVKHQDNITMGMIDYIEWNGIANLALEYATAGSLKDKVTMYGYIDEIEAIYMFRQSIKYIHLKDVMNRDIKPANIFLYHAGNGKQRNYHYIDTNLSKNY